MNDGEAFRLEYRLYDYPPPSGQVLIRVGPEVKEIGISDLSPQQAQESISLSASTRLDLTVEAHGFRGEFRIRLYDTRVLESGLRNLVTAPWPE